MLLSKLFRCCGSKRPLQILISNKTLTTSPVRCYSSSIRNAKAFTRRDPNKITPMGWFLLLAPVTTFGLGCWQIKRKTWKENLLRDLNDKTKSEPVPLPNNLEDLNSMEYRPVKVRGKFLHDKEICMGPRSLIHPYGAESRSSLMTARDDSVGYHIITPFKLSGREETILVNRGWVPRKFKDAASRPNGQINGEIELVGVVRLNENRPQFTPETRGEIYLYRDLTKMCSVTGAYPVFIDANYESSVPGGPVGGQTRIALRNEHFSYIVTWFSLSGATALMWYRLIWKTKTF